MNDRFSNFDRSTAILQMLGETYLARGQFAEAAAKFSELVAAGKGTPETFRHLALALGGLNALDDNARPIYQQALQFFPHDRELLLKTCRVLLAHNAREPFAMQLYKQALLLNPPAGHETLLALAQHFWRNEQAQPAFETLKRLALFENGGRESTLAQLVPLGWRLEKYADTRSVLAYLAGRNEKAAWLQRWLALDSAYAWLRVYATAEAKQTQPESAPSYPARDWRWISQALPAYDRLERLAALREFSVLQLALAGMHHQQAALQQSPAQSASFFEELAQRLPALSQSQPEPALRPAANAFPKFLVILKISNFEKLLAEAGETLAQALANKFMDFAAKYLLKASQAHCFRLRDGLLAFADAMPMLAIAALDLLHKIERYNATAKPAAQIWVQITAHAAAETPEPAAVRCWRMLCETLHLSECQRAPNAAAGAAKMFGNAFIMARPVYESHIGYQVIPAKSAGVRRSPWPFFRAEICEAIWRNPLEYVEEKKPCVFGKFWVTVKLRGGREAGVYRARDRELERQVLLKALSPANSYRLVQDVALRERVVAALRQIGRLALPGIATIYDMGFQEEIFFFVREFLEGKSLDHIIQSGRRLSLAEGLALALRVCRILHEAHRAGVVHGNLKPGNIWLSPNGEVVIADFFVPVFVEKPDPGNLLNPAAWQYSAPERRKAASPQPAHDVFSLGAILYEALTGELPPAAAEASAPPLRNEAPPAPPLIAEIVAQACHPQAQERFQSFAEFEQILRQALEQLRKNEALSFDEITRWPQGRRLLRGS